jgi:hypothetical protein
MQTYAYQPGRVKFKPRGFSVPRPTFDRSFHVCQLSDTAFGSDIRYQVAGVISHILTPYAMVWVVRRTGCVSSPGKLAYNVTMMPLTKLKQLGFGMQFGLQEHACTRRLLRCGPFCSMMRICFTVISHGGRDPD